MKNVCFWCIFGRWIQIYFQNFSITHTFRSRLKGWNLFRPDTSVFYRGRHEEFKNFFSQEDDVVFCNDVRSVMAINIVQINGACSLIRQKWAWRWFYSTTEIDSPSVPLVHAANIKESYESIKLLLGKINYDEFKCKLCGDLNVVALLLGMQI
jgi:hypothetical protein